jgi:hypothetical protein
MPSPPTLARTGCGREDRPILKTEGPRGPRSGLSMAIMQIQEFEVEEDERTTANYDSVSGRLNVDADPPKGLVLHSAGYTGQNSFRIASVWESEEAWQSFRDGRLAEALKPLMESGEGSPPTAEYTYELHHLLRP